MLDEPSLATVLRCAGARWTAQIGDPTLTGWLTVAAYLACMALAIAVWRQSPLRAERGAERRFWALVALTMAVLAVNKQLDLQSALTATGRCLAQLQGWYAERRSFQRQFILVLLAGAGLGLGLGLWLMRRHLRRNGLALGGLAIVAGYVAVRAVGFHHMETLINTRALQGVRFNFVFEIAGLVLIGANAAALLAGGRRAAEGRAQPPSPRKKAKQGYPSTRHRR